MLDTPFAPWPSFSTEEFDAVRGVLATNRVNYWTGDHGRKFEKEFAAFAKTRYAIALANGTVALDAALIALDIGAGDEEAGSLRRGAGIPLSRRLIQVSLRIAGQA